MNSIINEFSMTNQSTQNNIRDYGKKIEESEAQTLGSMVSYEFISNLDEEQLETPVKIDAYFVNENSLIFSIVNGTFENNTGVLQVQRNGSAWGTVCDDDFNDVTARVICGWIGYKYLIFWRTAFTIYVRYYI